MQKSIKYQIPKIGLGSSFHKVETLEIQRCVLDDFLLNYQIFYTGRHAIKHLIETILISKEIKKIWLPHYYCQRVTAWLRQNYDNIEQYKIDPFNHESNIDIESFASIDDIVILNNFWGHYSYKIPTKQNKAIYIEDHSHGWLSSGCTKSKADYCFASLRKSLPIPLGGICWKPNKLIQVSEELHCEDNIFYGIWENIESAMQLKVNFSNKDLTNKYKEEYLNIFSQTAEDLHNNFNLVKLKPEHRSIIEKFLNINILIPKEKNLAFLLKQINPNSSFKVIKHKNEVSYGLHLIFKDENVFINFKNYLVKQNIYPSFLWPENIKVFEWQYFLNIHVDFRYTYEDMYFIAEQINAWTHTN